jgi:hypothetical protein
MRVALCRGTSPSRGVISPNNGRCTEQNRRKAVAQSYGTTADSFAMFAGPPAIRSRPGSVLAVFRALDGQSRGRGPQDIQ